MNYVVTCMVGLLVSVGIKLNHANIELKGIEVKELSSEISLVDFTADIRAKHLHIIGPTVRPQNMNLCTYRPKDVVKFNSTPP